MFPSPCVIINALQCANYDYTNFFFYYPWNHVARRVSVSSVYTIFRGTYLFLLPWINAFVSNLVTLVWNTPRSIFRLQFKQGLVWSYKVTKKSLYPSKSAVWISMRTLCASGTLWSFEVVCSWIWHLTAHLSQTVGCTHELMLWSVCAGRKKS